MHRSDINILIIILTKKKLRKNLSYFNIALSKLPFITHVQYNLYSIICYIAVPVSLAPPMWSCLYLPGFHVFRFRVLNPIWRYVKTYLSAVCRFSEHLPSVSVENSVLLNVLQRNGFRCSYDTYTCQICPRGTYSRGDGVSKGCLPCPAGNTTGTQYYLVALNYNTDTPVHTNMF